ncbi:MAG: M15 family metallopeptidase [Clostridia bacterium]|nr:M15 family metallopeptidase [Clostridia bacterium]
MNNTLTTYRSIEELTPNAQKACNLFMAECKRQGLNVLITETYRSQARQDYLYAQGRTRSGKIVTWAKNSRHTLRRAWDICKNVKGQEYSDNAFFRKCGEIAAKLGITWGGTWNTPDMPHFEIPADWKGEEINMEDLEILKREFNAYVEHTNGIINAMGQEIQSVMKENERQNNIINLMGQELEDLRKLHNK